jgi:hypothetical protein
VNIDELYRKTVLCVPVYSHAERDTQTLIETLMSRGMPRLDVHGNGLIGLVRSEIANKALEEGFERMFWLDADMHAEISTIDRMLVTSWTTGVEVLSGAYVTRERNSRPVGVFDYESPHWPTIDRSHVLLGADGGLYPMRRIGFGCVVTAASAFRKVDPIAPVAEIRGKRRHHYFAEMLWHTADDERTLALGEDYSLCERWREVGVQPFVDTRWRWYHIGTWKYTWEDVGGARSREYETVDMGVE